MARKTPHPGRSDAAQRLARLHKDLLSISAQITEFIATHGAECRCVYCRGPGHSSRHTRGADVDEDLRGMGWTVEAIRSFVNGHMVGWP